MEMSTVLMLSKAYVHRYLWLRGFDRRFVETEWEIWLLLWAGCTWLPWDKLLIFTLWWCLGGPVGSWVVFHCVLHVEKRVLEECFSHLRFGTKPIIAFFPGTKVGAIFFTGSRWKLSVTRNLGDKLGWLGNSYLLCSSPSFTCQKNRG